MNNKTLIYFALVISCFLFSLQSYSQKSRATLERNRKEIQQEIRTIRSLLSETKYEKQSLLTQLNQTAIRIKAQEELIVAFKLETNALSSDITKIKRQLKN